MYGETGDLMRAELAGLLRQHRITQRLGGPGPSKASTAPLPEREELAHQILQYRQTTISWCSQTLHDALPVAFSNLPVKPANPFKQRHPHSAAAELARALEHTRRQSPAPLASLDLLTTPSGNAVVERWRQVARAAALAEHDTRGTQAHRLAAAQAQALTGDVAAITQALVVLDQRYRNVPGWEHLTDPARLGWAALATALDVSLGRPDYTVDQTGWRPRVKQFRGPVKPGILGVLQAEHNLLVHLRSVPTAMNLRLIADSQRLLSSRLTPYAARIDDRLGDQWQTRATTYALIQRQLRDIGGRAGTGTPAAAEAANAVSRLQGVPAHDVIEPSALNGFHTLFTHIDDRLADLIEDGIQRRAYLQRVTLPRLVEDTDQLIHPVRERFMPIADPSDHPLVQTVRRQLRPPPPPAEVGPPSPGPSRADLHAALIHQPEPRPRRGDHRGPQHPDLFI